MSENKSTGKVEWVWLELEATGSGISGKNA